MQIIFQLTNLSCCSNNYVQGAAQKRAVVRPAQCLMQIIFQLTNLSCCSNNYVQGAAQKRAVVRPAQC
jgi:hypothetical protein